MDSKHRLWIVILIFLVAGCSSQHLSTVVIHIEDMPMTVEVARTPEQRQKGLMFRRYLGADRGMLFVFEQEDRLSFWMKNTRIPLSIAYISKDGVIKEIHDMEPFSEASVPSEYSVLYALEVNQGFFAEKGIVPGNRVSFPEDL